MTNLTDDEYEKISRSFAEEIEALGRAYNVEHMQMTAKIKNNPSCIQVFSGVSAELAFEIDAMHRNKQVEILKYNAMRLLKINTDNSDINLDELLDMLKRELDEE